MVQESFGLEKNLCPGKFCGNKRLFPYTFKRHKVVKFARLQISSKAKIPKLNPSVAKFEQKYELKLVTLHCLNSLEMQSQLVLSMRFLLYIIPLITLCTVHLLPPDSLLWLPVSTPHQGEFSLVASIKVKFLASVTKNVALSFWLITLKI